jgi:predicted nuclease of restriction endonuclease-like (RecB) superfamily
MVPPAVDRTRLNVLTHHISTQLRERDGKALTNFSRTLPAEDSDLTQQILRDPYSFEFLTLSSSAGKGAGARAAQASVLFRAERDYEF